MNHFRTLSHLICASIILLAISGCSRSSHAATHDSKSDCPYSKDGFFTQVHDGRLWVFAEDSDSIAEFKSVGEPAKSVTSIGVGPGGMTIRSDSKASIIAYLGAKPSFYTEVVDGRLWILKQGSEALKEFKDVGEPGKNTTFIGTGPLGTTVRTDSKETFLTYLASKAGFWVKYDDGRIWILKENSEAHKQMNSQGDIAKNVTLIGKGPMGTSIRSDDKETVLEWAATVDGFNTYIREGRIWIFMPGSEHEQEFLKIGEPAKSVTKVGAGPMGCTLRAAERDVIARYMSAIR